MTDSQKGSRERVVRGIRTVATVFAVAALAACATGQAMDRAEQAAKTGDWDAAVAYYREALLEDPDRLEARIKLEQASRMASGGHMNRARDLEAQDHLPGAVAEYRLAADLDPSNTMAIAKAAGLERRIREATEAARPRPRIEELRAEAGLTPFPRLDPRTRVPALRFPNASVRDILRTIADFTGINITFDQGVDSFLNRSYSIDVQDVPLEEVLNQVLTANQLTFKVVNPQTIFIYNDTAQKRGQFEELYVQSFYLSHADATEAQQLITQLTQTGAAIRPVIQPQKAANALVVKATAPVLQIIADVIRTIDKPRAEVIIDVEILEVDRQRARQLGIDLGSYTIGFQLSPGGPPGADGAVPPFSVNQAANATSQDVYMSVPTAQIRLLESDTKTRVLAKPQLRGQEGATLSLNLGDDIPVAQTTFGAVAAGGVQTVPQTSYTYRRVGVNVTMTPRVTYNDEIILDPLQVENSGLGANIDVAGVSLPSFISRTATTSMRLRDGESNLLAGLIRQQDRELLKGIPGIMSIPGLRRLLGSEDSQFQESDIIMIVTPRIVRSKELTVDDLRPLFVGTGTNLGASQQPQLISPGAPPAPAGALPSAGRGGAPPQVQTPPAGELPPVGTRAPGVVPIQPVGAQPAQPAPAGIAQISVNVPGGELQAGGPPYNVPIAVNGVSRLGTVALTITYDPKVLRAVSVTQGGFMAQGGVTPAFTPKIDEPAGRIDLVITRVGDTTGASGDGLLAGIVFEAIAPGSTQIVLAGVANDPSGQALPARLVPASVTVR